MIRWITIRQEVGRSMSVPVEMMLDGGRSSRGRELHEFHVVVFNDSLVEALTVALHGRPAVALGTVQYVEV